MSSDLTEWTSTAVGTVYFRVRGGNFISPADALSCDYDFRAPSEGTATPPDIGFRCFPDVYPQPLIFLDEFKSIPP